MFYGSQESIVVFIVCVIALLLVFTIFIAKIITKIQGRKIIHQKELEELQVLYANTLLQAQLEIQEQTFQQISREIHDNINQKLTLAKLYLNKLSYDDIDVTKLNIDGSLELISAAITDLTDLSKSMSTDLIANYGLVKVIEMEAEQLVRLSRYVVDISVAGQELFMEVARELVLFRIVQETLNNIVKHANASKITIAILYSDYHIELQVTDDGVGLDVEGCKTGNGLINMQKRATHLGGTFNITSNSNRQGTTVEVKIPTYA